MARLACYDAAAEHLASDLHRGEVSVVDNDQVRALRRQSFGFSIPSIDVFGGPSEPNDRIAVDLADAYPGPEHRWVMITADGAVWRQTDQETITEEPHKGSKLAVRRAALGSFFCNVDGQRAVRCERSR